MEELEKNMFFGDYKRFFKITWYLTNSSLAKKTMGKVEVFCKLGDSILVINHKYHKLRKYQSFRKLICILPIAKVLQKVLQEPGNCRAFEGILGHYRASWGHKNTMMSVLYRLESATGGHGVGGSNPLVPTRNRKYNRVL